MQLRRRKPKPPVWHLYQIIGHRYARREDQDEIGDRIWVQDGGTYCGETASEAYAVAWAKKEEG